MRSLHAGPAQLSGQSKRLRLAVTVILSTFLTVAYLTQRTSQADSIMQEAEAKNPVPALEKNIALGLAHFSAHCATCHVHTGKSDAEKSRSGGAPNLASDEVQSKSDQELYRIVSNGIQGTAMPAFGKTHKPDDIWSTILFLRRLPSLTIEERKKLEATITPDARHKNTNQESDARHDSEKSTQHEHHHNESAARPDQPAHKHEDAKATQKKNESEHHGHHQNVNNPEAAPANKPVMSNPQHQHSEQPAVTKQGASKASDQHANHDMTGMNSGHSSNAMMATVIGGPFKSMNAIGSGTSLMPASASGYMWHWMKGDWMVMAHGDLKTGFNHQGGPRGINKAESQNWFMLMAERPVGRGQLMLRGMFSAEPWTAPRRGFPELFQTGETFGGRPIIDAQHAHDLFMELAASYTHPLSENVSIHLYGGPVGEPALGPVAFMHRASASENPAAPLGHHWQDSTHIAHGVFTAGVTAWRFRVEGSIFRGAEPDENRKDLELGKLDSWSGRIWFTPTPDWTMQFSRGHLTNPEALEPGDLERMTASISYNHSWSNGNWASSLIWGRNDEEHGISNAYLLESTANFMDKNYLYTRLELGDKIGLLQENIFGRAGLEDHHHAESIPVTGDGSEHHDLADQWFRVGAFTFGGVRDIVADSKLRVGIGADVTFYHVPEGLKTLYGSSPTSFHVFLRIRPGKMEH